MNQPRSSSSVQRYESNPFTRWSFWGRQKELAAIDRYLLSEQPQNCAVIGETFIGKTALLRALCDPQRVLLAGNGPYAQEKLTFVYLDCAIYVPLSNQGNITSSKFWWELYSSTQRILQPGRQSQFPKADSEENYDTYEMRSTLEELIDDHGQPVIFVFDNFEGIASLPIRDSAWLRALVQQHRCAYVVASRYLLYLLYHHHPENFISPSPLWNIFTDPLYLGLLEEHEVQNRLRVAQEEASHRESPWTEEDLHFIRQCVGRHPALLRIACSHLFELRRQTHEQEFDLLRYRIAMDSSPICDWLWRSLSDRELQGEPRAQSLTDQQTERLSPYQYVLLAIAYDQDAHTITLPQDYAHTIPVKDMLFTLEQRGLIERTHERYQPFCEIMSQFIRKQSTIRDLSPHDNQTSISATNQSTNTPQNSMADIPFTHLEGQVYAYLRAHTGHVCSRAEIKAAIWEHDQPTDSALQKIIERIRTKIEPVPDNPRYLIAIRGQGYMLRETN